MFDLFHDNCNFNLWSPVDAGGGIEDVAFSAYAKHEQEKEDIIQTIINEAMNGNTDFSVDIDDYLSDNDVEYIKSEIIRRYREGS